MLPTHWRAATAALGILLTMAPAAHAAEGVPVAVSDVREQQIFRQVTITGTVTSPSVARLSPATDGLVLEVLADAGDRVARGDVLLQLDDELAALQLRSALAQRQQAATALADAERRLREARQLAPQQSIAETAVRALEAEVAADRAALDQASADADYSQALLARHRVRAPFAGVISSKLTDPGEWITRGTAVFELVATGELRMDFAVPEDYLAALPEDAPVRFGLNALPGQTFAGRVQTIVPVTDPGARTFLLRVLPQEQDANLQPGMSAHATLLIPQGQAGLVVPRDATVNYPDGRVVVWTVEGSGDSAIARENFVQTGASFDGSVEVSHGLAAGQRVVVKGNEALSDGQRVRVVGSP